MTAPPLPSTAHRPDPPSAQVIQVYAQMSNDYQAFMQQQGDTGTGTGTGAGNNPGSDADQSGGDERNCS